MEFDIRTEINKIQDNQDPINIHKLVLSRLKNINYKLYRYCPFDETKDPFSDDFQLENTNLNFKNVLNQQIYASKPSGFNDPFDCIIGVSTQTILSAIVMSFINTNYLQHKINKNETKRILNGEINHEKAFQLLSHKAPNLINDVILGIINNNKIQQRLMQSNKKRITKEETKELFREIFQDKTFIESFVHNFLKPGFSTNESINKLRSLLMNNSFLMSQLLLEPVKMDFDSDGKIVDFNLSIEKLETIAFQQGYNVSQESSQLREILEIAFSIARKGLDEFYNQIDTQFGVTCFSSKSDIALMWSHYAKKHTGFVIEYDLSNLSIDDAEKITFLFPVKYSTRRANLDNRILEDVDLLKKDFNYSGAFLGSIIQTIYTKANVWRYEKEWRNISLLSHTKNRTVPFKYISSIILGCKTPQESFRYFQHLSSLFNVRINQYRLDDDSYKLVLIENVIENFR